MGELDGWTGRWAAGGCVDGRARRWGRYRDLYV